MKGFYEHFVAVAIGNLILNSVLFKALSKHIDKKELSQLDYDDKIYILEQLEVGYNG